MNGTYIANESAEIFVFRLSWSGQPHKSGSQAMGVR
jgi:hypothetical protein